MKASKETVFKLELNKEEFETMKECLEVFETEGLNEQIEEMSSKLNDSQLITLNEINNHLEVIG